VQNDPVRDTLTAPGTGGDPAQGSPRPRDVQQQRPLPQVRRRHDVPELSRHARREAPDARRANTLRLALSGHFGERPGGDECARRSTCA
jgi:hypothetical protein